MGLPYISGKHSGTESNLLHTKSGAYIGWHSACMGYENFLAYHFCYIQPSKWGNDN